jgi:hypothetical protein
VAGFGSDGPDSGFGSVESTTTGGAPGVWPGNGAAPPAVAAASSAGVGPQTSAFDHTHQGVLDITSASAQLSVAVAGANRSIGQTIAADWPIANVRWYTLDAGIAASGVGFSDASSAAAGLVAKKTVAELGAIIPRVGNDRKICIVIKAGSYVGQGDPGLLLTSGLAGYNSIIIVATDTNATAGAVAFAGDANDRNFAGFTTATGMNAAGYKPVAAFSASLVKCLTFGGAGPAFAAEPAMPLFVRMRFDVATTTAALRNVSRWIRVVTGADTLTPLSALPAVPVGTDVFYLEMPNAVTDAWTVATPAQTGQSSIGAVVGIRSAGTINFTGDGNLRLAGCLFGNINAGATGNGATIICDASYTDELAVGRNVGMGARSEGIFVMSSRLTAGASPAIGSVGNTQIQLTGNFAWSNGAASFGGLNVTGAPGRTTYPDAGSQSSIGGRSHNAEPPCRIRGTVTGNGLTSTGMAVRWSGCVVDALDISNNAGFQGCMALLGTCQVSFSSFYTGTGNTDVALDLTISYGSQIFIYSAPTCTGAVGDIRLADGTIISWANAMKGVVDTNGNIITGPAGFTPLKWVAVAPGVAACAMTNAPAGTPATPVRYAKLPDGAGGFFTVPSLT